MICGPVESVVGDFKVAIAGPLTHIPQMLVWVGIFAACEKGSFENFSQFPDTANASFGGNLSAQAFFLNLTLFIFNLFVPAYPLDGGRCLAAGLILCGMSVVNAAMGTAFIGMLFAAAMIVWGIIIFIQGSPGGFFTMLIGAWIFMTSFGLFKLTRPAHGTSTSEVNSNMANENLKSHPVFGQRCYQERARAEAQGGS